MDDFMDLVILVLLLAMGGLNLPSFFNELSKPIVSTVEDKTALNANGELRVDDVRKTGSDIFMSLVVADEYTPFPRSIRINDTPIIDLNKEWLADKYSNLSTIYAANGQYKLGSMLGWVLKEEYYVNNNGDSYIQYILTED